MSEPESRSLKKKLAIVKQKIAGTKVVCPRCEEYGMHMNADECIDALKRAIEAELELRRHVNHVKSGDAA
jgi:hypothetical protein